MRLYSGSSVQFIEDTIQNQIAEKLRASFFSHFRYDPAPGEIQSWRNSLSKMKDVIESAELLDHGVMLEYQLPLTSRRLDCLVSGKDAELRRRAVVVELKQWEACQETDGELTVLTRLGGGLREVLHPAVQVSRYHEYLQDVHTAFYEGQPIGLSSCAYLHNYVYTQHDPLLSPKFDSVITEYPLFTADDFADIKSFMGERLGSGQGLEVLAEIERSKYRPSKKLMDHVAGVIEGKPEYILLDEQLVVYDRVLSAAARGFHDRRKRVILVRGGPGTGKSVIAINLMATLLRRGYNAHYATGSRAFTRTLHKVIGSRSEAQFRYFNSYAKADRDTVDVLIGDEAHRIRETSTTRFMKREDRTGLPQIEELISAAKVAVFFVDDLQVVRPGEIGSSDYIREQALRLGCQVLEYELEVQFRCRGSEAFVNWVNNTLGIRRTANVIWDEGEAFEFRLFDTPSSLERAVREKVDEGSTGRVTAGFCWKWSKPNADGTLPMDVVIGDYRRPWNAKPDVGRLATGIPPAPLWAYDPNGIDQVGCVYTAQGFEFDYVGVIFGKDLRYDFDSQTWIGDRDYSADPTVKRSGDRFTDLVKNTYRVLLSRGMRGCYVHFMDKETERFFKSRMEKPMPADDTAS